MHEADLLAGLVPFPRLMLERGEGSWVFDDQGKRYLDFTAGLGVLALGHGCADLAEVAGAQLGQLGHVSNLFGNEPSLELADRLVRSSFASRVWFANSGAEANEAALKFARLHGRRPGDVDGANERKSAIVAFEKGFHGRTAFALSVTHAPAYRDPFGPLVPGVRFATFNDVESVQQTMDDDVCAVIVEPVQGEGGVVPAERAFLEKLRQLCDQHEALLIFDEVQCGLGRTGSLYAYQGYDVVPDILCLAKPLAGGLPLGAVLINERVAALLRPGLHGSTFAGGPVACAVGVRLFDIVSQTAFLERVGAAAARLRHGLETIATEAPATVAGVRGLGLMQALVLRTPPPGKSDDGQAAERPESQQLGATGSPAGVAGDTSGC